MYGFGAEAFVSLKLLEIAICHFDFDLNDIELLFLRDLIDRFTCENMNPHHVSMENHGFKSLNFGILLSKIIFKMIDKNRLEKYIFQSKKTEQALKRSIIDFWKSQLQLQSFLSGESSLFDWNSILNYSLMIQIIFNINGECEKEGFSPFITIPSENVILTSLICKTILGNDFVIDRTILEMIEKKDSMEKCNFSPFLPSSILSLLPKDLDSIVKRTSFFNFGSIEKLFMEMTRHFQSESFKITQLNQELERKDGKMVELTAKILELQEINLQSERKISELLGERGEISKEQEMKNEKLENQFGILNCENNELTKKIQFLTKELELQKNNYNIEKEYQLVIEKHIEKQLEELKNFKEKLIESELKNESLEKDISLAKAENANLQTEKESLELLNENLKKELKRINDEKSEISTLNVMLESKLKIIKREINDNHEELKNNSDNKENLASRIFMMDKSGVQ